MSKLDQRFLEDRQLRDTARTVLMADIAHARTTLSAKGVADRIGGRIGDGTKDVFEVAKTHTDDNRGVIAALIGAVLLWLVREPILEILGLSQTGEGDEDGEPVDAANMAPDDSPASAETVGAETASAETASDVPQSTQSEDYSATTETLPPGDDDEQ